MNYKDFYTISEFSDLLGVHHNTVRRAIKSGKLAFIKFGTDKRGTHRIPHSEIERLVLSNLKKAILKSNIIDEI